MAGARKRAQEFHRYRRQRPAYPQNRRSHRSATVAYALELVGDRRRHPRRRLSDKGARPAARRLRAVRHLDSRKPALDHVFRLLGAGFARRPPAVVRRWRIHPHELERARLQTDASARRPVLPDHRRQEPDQAGRSRALVAPRHPRGRQCTAAGASSRRCRHRVSPAQYQCLSGAAGSRLSRLYRWRAGDPRHRRQGQSEDGGALGLPPALSRLYPHGRAVLRSRALYRQRRMRAHRRGRLAQARLDRRWPRRGKSGADLDLPAAAARNLSAPRRPLWRAQSLRECAKAQRLEIGSDRARDLFQWRAARLRHIKSLSAGGNRLFCSRAAARCAPSGAIQINDVFVDERQIVYTVDRHAGGLYTLEMDF